MGFYELGIPKRLLEGRDHVTTYKLPNAFAPNSLKPDLCRKSVVQLFSSAAHQYLLGGDRCGWVAANRSRSLYVARYICLGVLAAGFETL